MLVVTPLRSSLVLRHSVAISNWRVSNLLSKASDRCEPVHLAGGQVGGDRREHRLAVRRRSVLCIIVRLRMVIGQWRTSLRCVGIYGGRQVRWLGERRVVGRREVGARGVRRVTGDHGGRLREQQTIAVHVGGRSQTVGSQVGWFVDVVGVRRV